MAEVGLTVTGPVFFVMSDVGLFSDVLVSITHADRAVSGLAFGKLGTFDRLPKASYPDCRLPASSSFLRACTATKLFVVTRLSETRA